MSRYVKIKGVEIGIESNSGLAVSVYFPELDEHKWVPLSQVNGMRRNKNIHNDDMIEVAQWWADKEGLA